MTGRTAIIFGGTGLIGKALTQELTNSGLYENINSFTRRKPEHVNLLNVNNLVVDFYRSNKAMTYLDLDFVASEPSSTPEHLAEARFEQQQIRQAILELPGNQQQVVLMRFIEFLFLN